MIGVGVVGYGYWGPNLVRNFASLDGCALVAISDADDGRRALAQSRYPGVNTYAAFKDLLGDARIDAVAIATPVATHYDLAMEALKAGKHVLVEKPLAGSSSQAERLVAEAERRGLVLMVDHTFVYTGAVRRMRELVRAGELGELYYYDAVRVNLGLFRHDVNVVWDLAVHDLSIMDYVVPYQPRAVSAHAVRHISGQAEDIAYLTLFFDEPFIAHVHVNWLAPVKVRRSLLGGSRRMIVYDDLEPSEKVKIYDAGVSVNDSPEAVHHLLFEYRSGDMWAPQVDRTEALTLEAREFVSCISAGRKPITDGETGLRVVRILEAADRSLAQRGAQVAIG